MNHPVTTIPDPPLRVGTRGSALALAQADRVIALLQRAHPDRAFARQVITSEGDADQTSPLTQIGGRGVFTSALQVRLLRGDIDLAVHSAKDVPSLAPPGLTLAAFPEREDPRDALISRHGVGLADLPANPVIGTSSRRRAVQVLALRPDAVIRDVRGNIDTRLRKAQTGDYDAIILAVAGVTRMGWEDAITVTLPIAQFTPAPAQGAIAVETRTDAVATTVAAIDDPAVAAAVRIERAFLRGVGGGCTTPIGAHAVIAGGRVTLHAMLADDDGSRLVREDVALPPDTAEAGAFDLAARMLRETRPRWSTGRQAAPLSGKVVLLTGSASQAGPLRAALAAQGADVRHLETLRILPPAPEVTVPAGERFDWVVVTSPNAFPFATRAVRDAVAAGARLAVVGARTARAARHEGIEPPLVGERDAASLVEHMTATGIAGSRVLCLLSSKARPVLADGLRTAGAQVTVATAYRNEPAVAADPDVLATIAAGAVAVAAFASPSAVSGFVALVGERLAAMSGAAFVAIGDTTATAMRDHDLPVHAVASQPDPDGMVNAMRQALGGGHDE